jgi:hypothetical protein
MGRSLFGLVQKIETPTPYSIVFICPMRTPISR